MILVKKISPEAVVVLVTKGEEITAKADFHGRSALAHADMFAYYLGKESGRSNEIVYEGV
jgi:hypothetical protein